MKIKSLVAVGISAVSIICQTKASFIDGDIRFSSIPGKLVALTGGTSFVTATGLGFVAGPNAQVDGANGDFAPELGVTATFYNFTFAAGATPVWKLTDGHFSFDLNPGSVKDAGAHFLNVEGSGTVHDLTGVLSDTPGSFLLSTQGNPSSRNFKFSWSGEADAIAPVPEPNTIIAGASLLIPFGVAGFKAYRKKRTQ